MIDPTPKRAQKTAADLKLEWKQMLKNGMGLSQSSGEEKESLDMFDCRVEKVFLMYVEARMAKALDIEQQWLASESGIIGMPDSDDGDY